MRKARHPDCHPERKHLAKGLCEQCYNEKYYLKNSEKIIKNVKKWSVVNRDKSNRNKNIWKKRNPDKVREDNRKWSHENPVAVRKKHLRRYYNMTLEDYQAMLDSQNGLCAICGKISKKVLCVDHDHETGKVRGLLCDDCNMGIGRLKDELEIVENAVAYLRKHKK